jgi:hypothetical protein
MFHPTNPDSSMSKRGDCTTVENILKSEPPDIGRTVQMSWLQTIQFRILWSANIVGISNPIVYQTNFYKKYKYKLEEVLIRIRKYHSIRMLLTEEDFEKVRELLSSVSHNLVIWKMPIMKFLEDLKTQQFFWYSVYKQGV